MPLFKVTEADHQRGFARLKQEGDETVVTTDLVVLDAARGTPHRLRCGVVLRGEIRGARLLDPSVVEEAPPPDSVIQATDALVRSLRLHGLRVETPIPQLAAQEWRLDAKILNLGATGGPADGGHPVLARIVQPQLTLLIDWANQGYAEERLEHPFEDDTLPTRFAAATSHRAPGFSCRATERGYVVGAGQQAVPFGDWDWVHPHPFFVSITSIANQALASAGAAERWIDTQDEDWVLASPALAALLIEHELLMRPFC